MSRSDPIIPRSELTPGIERCVAQATKLFESSRVLLNAGMVDMAAVNYALGVQEVGKAQLLREGFDSGSPRAEIPGFTDHYVKVQKAATVLGSSALWLTGGAFQADAFQRNAFDVGIPADEPTRLDVLYVNFGSSGWRTPPPIDAADLGRQIEAVLRNLPAAKTKLLP